jgi:hypothetical protein
MEGMGVAWDPGLPLSRQNTVVRVGASDAEAVGNQCDVQIALKCRPETFADTGPWRKRSGPFALGELLKAIAEVHRRTRRGDDLPTALRMGKVTFVTQHPGVRVYLEHALDNYFDYHESRETVLGPLRMITDWTVVEKAPNVSIAAWGPLYEAEDGSREVRRLRVGKAHDEPTVWLPFAAHSAALAAGQRPATRIFVTEIGLLDASTALLVDGISPEEAERWWEDEGRPVARAATGGTARITGSCCADCKATTACPDLVRVNGAVQMSTPGPWLRTVSALDLAVYHECAARWFLERHHHLPAEREGNAGLLRGTAVHAWLEWAHSRAVPCTHEDLPNPVDVTATQLAEWALEAEDYEAAFPYLFAHVDTCPLSGRTLSPLTAEETLFTYDADADVVPVVKPDAMWREGDTLIAREYKSTEDPLPEDEDEARDRFGPLLPWLLTLLERGLMQHFGCSNAVVELEVITPAGARVYKFSTDDVVLMKFARRRIKSLSGAWHQDQTFATHSGPHCERCPVRRWCPDRDAYMSRRTASGGPVADDEPPF